MARLRMIGNEVEVQEVQYVQWFKRLAPFSTNGTNNKIGYQIRVRSNNKLQIVMNSFFVKCIQLPPWGIEGALTEFFHRFLTDTII
jgi:hypothetical protein